MSRNSGSAVWIKESVCYIGDNRKTEPVKKKVFMLFLKERILLLLPFIKGRQNGFSEMPGLIM